VISDSNSNWNRFDGFFIDRLRYWSRTGRICRQAPSANVIPALEAHRN